MKNILKCLAAAVMATGIAGASPAPTPFDGSDTAAALLAEARARVSQLAVDWKNAAEDAHVREDINAVVKTVTGLNSCRNQASPSQIATIDRIVPVMEEMVASTTSAVDYLNKNRARLSTKEYREYLDANSDTSGRLAGLVGKLVDFGSSREKFEKAKQTLALASK